MLLCCSTIIDLPKGLGIIYQEWKKHTTNQVLSILLQRTLSLCWKSLKKSLFTTLRRKDTCEIWVNFGAKIQILRYKDTLR